MRKAAVAAGVVALVLILAVLLVPRLISFDSVKPRIVSALEEKTGRRISLSGLSLSLFPGIGVKITGLEVSGDPGHPGEPLLTVPEGLVRVAIVPLLSGRAEFTRVVLRRPAIHFRTYRDGTHSATEIARRLGNREGPGTAAPPPPEEGEKIRVVLTSVEIEDGTLSLRIEEKSGRVTPWEISPISFRLTGIGRERNEFAVRTRLEGTVRGEIAFAGKSVLLPEKGAESAVFDLAGEGTIFGQKVTAGGKVSSPRGATEVDLAFAFPKIEMGKLAGIWKDSPPALAAARLEGVGSLTGTVSGALRSPGFQARADLTRAGWTMGDPPGLRKPVDFPFTLDLAGRYSQDTVRISSAELRTPPLHLVARAVLEPATGAREWEASSQIASLAALGKIPGAGLSGWDPVGQLTVSAKGKRAGTGRRESYRVAVDLAEVGFRVPERRVEFRSLSGHAEATPDAVRATPLSGLLNGHRFVLQGDAALGPKSTGQVDFRIAYLDVDALFPPEEKGRKEEKETPSKKGEAESGRREVSVRADLRIDAGKARGVEFQNLKGKVRYEGGNLYLDSVSARMYGGDVRLSGRVGLGAPSPDFRVKVTATDLAAEEILSRKTTLKDFLSGPASLSAEIGGGMKSFDDFARTGAGSGSVKITDGKIKGVDLLAAAAGLAGLEAIVPAAPAGPAATRGETKFSDLSADFRVEQGKIHTEALTILAAKMGLTGNAVVGFDRTIDFRGTMLLSREMSERVRGKAGKFLVGRDGRVEIPLTITGPLASPAVAIDPAALAKGVAGKVLRGLVERIPGSRPPPAGADNAAPAAKPEQAEPFQEVEGLFKKIFPRKQE